MYYTVTTNQRFTQYPHMLNTDIMSHHLSLQVTFFRAFSS